MAIPLLSEVWPHTDDELFPALNLVMIGWLLLVFLPRWRYTPTTTLCLCLVYSAMYAVLVGARLATGPLPEGGGLSSLAEVVALFSDRSIVFAGWTHYIAFDLFVARHIVLDSQVAGISHALVVWLLPLTLMAGPCGLVVYYCVKAAWLVCPSGSHPVLVILYVAVSSLCAMMVSWVLVFPASWRAGDSVHDERLRGIWEDAEAAGVPLPTPLNLVLKYAGHSFVQLTHILPSAMWAAMIPIQLNPKVRSQYRRAHRWAGYGFFGSSLLVLIGFFAITHRKLDYIHSDFPTIPHHEHLSDLGLDWVPYEALAVCMAVWFGATATMALLKARARDFAAHKRWVYRHVASGLWVALQRVYVLAIGSSCRGKPTCMKATFGDGIAIGMTVSVMTAELAIWMAARASSNKKSPKKSE